MNDRTTARFEGLWPIPRGVSYNSYLVIGEEKTAIIDGVETSHALEQIDAIRRILGDRRPDYLVIPNSRRPSSLAVMRIDARRQLAVRAESLPAIDRMLSSRNIPRRRLSLLAWAIATSRSA